MNRAGVESDWLPGHRHAAGRITLGKTNTAARLVAPNKGGAGSAPACIPIRTAMKGVSVIDTDSR